VAENSKPGHSKILVGYPGDEHLCSHDHGYRDECLSFDLAPTLTLLSGS
jgi:hypothetical protein